MYFCRTRFICNAFLCCSILQTSYACSSDNGRTDAGNTASAIQIFTESALKTKQGIPINLDATETEAKSLEALDFRWTIISEKPENCREYIIDADLPVATFFSSCLGTRLIQLHVSPSSDLSATPSNQTNITVTVEDGTTLQFPEDRIEVAYACDAEDCVTESIEVAANILDENGEYFGTPYTFRLGEESPDWLSADLTFDDQVLEVRLRFPRDEKVPTTFSFSARGQPRDGQDIIIEALLNVQLQNAPPTHNASSTIMFNHRYEADTAAYVAFGELKLPITDPERHGIDILFAPEDDDIISFDMLTLEEDGILLSGFEWRSNNLSRLTSRNQLAFAVTDFAGARANVEQPVEVLNQPPESIVNQLQVPHIFNPRLQQRCFDTSLLLNTLFQDPEGDPMHIDEQRFHCPERTYSDAVDIAQCQSPSTLRVAFEPIGLNVCGSIEDIFMEHTFEWTVSDGVQQSDTTTIDITPYNLPPAPNGLTKVDFSDDHMTESDLIVHAENDFIATFTTNGFSDPNGDPLMWAFTHESDIEMTRLFPETPDDADDTFFFNLNMPYRAYVSSEGEFDVALSVSDGVDVTSIADLDITLTDTASRIESMYFTSDEAGIAIDETRFDYTYRQRTQNLNLPTPPFNYDTYFFPVNNCALPGALCENGVLPHHLRTYLVLETDNPDGDPFDIDIPDASCDREEMHLNVLQLESFDGGFSYFTPAPVETIRHRGTPFEFVLAPYQSSQCDDVSDLDMQSIRFDVEAPSLNCHLYDLIDSPSQEVTYRSGLFQGTFAIPDDSNPAQFSPAGDQLSICEAR